MRAELLQLAADLAKKGEPFVLAMVVRRESYSSAQQGDMAVITADGAYHGWLGGNCTQPTVKREALGALADGKPRLVSLSHAPIPQQWLVQDAVAVIPERQASSPLQVTEQAAVPQSVRFSHAR